jgi:hypothetical protein
LDITLYSIGIAYLVSYEIAKKARLKSADMHYAPTINDVQSSLVSHLKYLELLVNIDLMWKIAGHSHVALPDPYVANIIGVAISTVKILSGEEMNNQFNIGC